MRLSQLSLRLRIFLFFALLGLGGIVLVALGLFVGYRQLGNPEVLGGFVFGGVLAGFAILALTTWIWVLFDEHVARPVDRISAELRARAHAGIDADLEADLAVHLGDLAPAAAAVSERLTATRNALAEAVGRETARLSRETARLAAVLAEMPQGVVLCGADHRIILYNLRARQVLGAPEAFGLGRALDKVLQPGPLLKAYDWLSDPATPDLAEIGGVRDAAGAPLQVRMRLIRFEGQSGKPGYLLMMGEGGAESAPLPASVEYDFDLMSTEIPADLAKVPLRQLSYVVFDTETTGLDPSRDEICQIAGLRIVGARAVETEIFDMLVHPGRNIPSSATEVHHIDDTMVADAPQVGTALARFHDYAGQAVLVAHNAPFDMAFLKRREAEIGAVFDQPILDTVLLSAIVYGQATDHTLDALSARLDIVIPEAERHTALGDARATAQVLIRLISMLEAKGIETLGAVLQEAAAHRRVIADANTA